MGRQNTGEPPQTNIRSAIESITDVTVMVDKINDRNAIRIFRVLLSFSHCADGFKQINTLDARSNMFSMGVRVSLIRQFQTSVQLPNAITVLGGGHCALTAEISRKFRASGIKTSGRTKVKVTTERLSCQSGWR